MAAKNGKRARRDFESYMDLKPEDIFWSTESSSPGDITDSTPDVSKTSRSMIKEEYELTSGRSWDATPALRFVVPVAVSSDAVSTDAPKRRGARTAKPSAAFPSSGKSSSSKQHNAHSYVTGSTMDLPAPTIMSQPLVPAHTISSGSALQGKEAVTEDQHEQDDEEDDQDAHTTSTLEEIEDDVGLGGSDGETDSTTETIPDMAPEAGAKPVATQEKKIHRKCSHGRRKYDCRDCGGGGICSHGRNRTSCSICSICSHGVLRKRCKECNSKGFCTHGIYKYDCMECWTGRLCEHRQKLSSCNECRVNTMSRRKRKKGTTADDASGAGALPPSEEALTGAGEAGTAGSTHTDFPAAAGSEVKQRRPRKCVHGLVKAECEECRPSKICVHNRKKNQCKDCGGTAFCQHGRIKYYCKDCGGRALCTHGRKKYDCRECGGAGICEHDRRWYQCSICRTKRAETKQDTAGEGIPTQSTAEGAELNPEAAV